MILDRGNGPGEGSTVRATGGYRAQYATAVNVRLSLLTRAKLQAFEQETGVDPGYLPAGYLWLAGTPEELAVLDAGREVQHAAGLDEAVEVSPADIGRLDPAISLDGIAGGTFCPSDGFLRPLKLLEGLSPVRPAAAVSGSSGGWTCPACVVTATDGSPRSRHRGVRSRSRPS